MGKATNIEWTDRAGHDIVHSLWEIESARKNQQLQKLEFHTKNGKPDKPKANLGVIAANNGSQSLLLAATNQGPMGGHPPARHALVSKGQLVDTESPLNMPDISDLEAQSARYADATKSWRWITATHQEKCAACCAVGAMGPSGNFAIQK